MMEITHSAPLYQIDYITQNFSSADPHHWRSKRSVPQQEIERRTDRQMVLIDALGNAAQARSFFIIASHANSSETPGPMRRAALHALRHFDNDLVRLIPFVFFTFLPLALGSFTGWPQLWPSSFQAAGILMETALFDPDDHMRSTAVDLYFRHPQARNLLAIHAELLEGCVNRPKHI